MADFVFPSTNDDLSEANLRRAFKKVSNAKDYVRSGFTVTIGAGLNVSVAAGEAYVNGTYIERNVSSSLAVAANSTLYVYAAYDDATQNTVVLGTTTTAPTTETGWTANPERILLAQVVTGASTVTSVSDKRNTVATSGWVSSS